MDIVYFETLQIFDYSDFYWLYCDGTKAIWNFVLKLHFWCYPGYDRCLLVLRIPYLE